MPRTDVTLHIDPTRPDGYRSRHVRTRPQTPTALDGIRTLGAHHPAGTGETP
jgi:hypothetical protein